MKAATLLALVAAAGCALAPANSFFQCGPEGCDGGVVLPPDSGFMDSGCTAPNTLSEFTPVVPSICAPCGQMGQPCCAGASATCLGRTFYIDCADGDDGNDGLEETASPGSGTGPWKHHPFMLGFLNNYEPLNGDRFIFKGGVICPPSDFPLIIANTRLDGGPPNYYGIDTAWFAGATWTQPVFDFGQVTTLPGEASYVNADIDIAQTAGSLVFDNFELRGHYWDQSGLQVNVAIYDTSDAGTTIENCTIHDWAHGALGGDGGVIDNFCAINGPGVRVMHTLIEDADAGRDGHAVCSASEVLRSTIHDVAGGITAIVAHHNTVYNVINVSSASTVGIGANIAFNNLIRHVEGAVAPLQLLYGPGVTTEAWNNIIYTVPTAPVYLAPISGCTDCSTSRPALWNNTLEASGTAPCVGVFGVDSGLALDNENNLCLTDGTTLVSGGLGDGGFLVLNAAAAAAANFTAANAFAPIDAGAPTQAAGVNLSNACDGMLGAPCSGTDCATDLQSLCSDRLGKPRPGSGPWDVGASQYE